MIKGKHKRMVLSMKKRFLLLLILAAILTSALSASHDMEIIPLSSPVYEYMESLYVLEGKAAPQGAKPWTVADVKQQLDRINPTSVPAQNLYDILSEYTDREDEKDVKVDVDMSLTPSIGLHINNTDFDESGKWRSKVLNDKLLHLNGSLYVYDYFAADMGLSVGLMNSVQAYGEKDVDADGNSISRWYPSEHEDRFSERMASNIPFLSSGDIDVDVTDNSYVSVGVPYISLSLGRGQLSLGNGKMGNLILGNTLPYHDYLSISASNNTWFDYTMLMSFFTHPVNYYHVKYGDDDRTSGKESDINGIQMFIAHRFEMRMFSDKLRLSINEATMYQSEDNTIDFRVFNPLLIMHGFYISANANSLASIELEFAPVKNLQLYASFVIDDLSVFGEPKVPEKNSTLNMWGVMGGMRVSVPAKKGYFTLGLEAVYTSPFMYHKETYNGATAHSLDFIGSIRHNMGESYNRQYLSFPFGSDALAALLDVKYTNPMKWSLGMNIFAMMHGTTDIDSTAKRYDGEMTEVPGWISDKNPFEDDGKNSISYTFDIGFNAGCYLTRNLSLNAAVDFIYVANMDNIAGNSRQDIQFTLAVEYNIF